MILPEINWKDPDYAPIIKERIRRLQWIREDPEKRVPPLKKFYADEPWNFLTDWGWTSDPRNAEIGKPVLVPFLLFPKQVELAQWLVERWRAREAGVMPKSREVGATWVLTCTAATLAMFIPDLAIGVGSRKLELVDSLDDPKAIFPKIRQFLQYAPPEFTGRWTSREKLIRFPNGSTIAGEGGDDIGRGARTAMYLVDEAAFLQHPETTDAALSATSNCRIFFSSFNGSNNPFYRKTVEWASDKVFKFHWRDDPRKDDAWYAKKCEELDPVIVAQEIDMDPNASTVGIIIPSAHIQAAIDAHIHLGIDVTGVRQAAFDVADEGLDKCAWVSNRGILIEHVEEWSGKGSDIYASVVRAAGLCDEYGIDSMIYDADGMGAAVRGDVRLLNEARKQEAIKRSTLPKIINAIGFHGSGEVQRKSAPIYPGANRTNEDYYKNLKAQGWGRLQRMFRETYRARTDPDYKYDPADLISLSSKIPDLTGLTTELSQPTWEPNNTGHMVVNKMPDGARSPNRADVVMMVRSGLRRPMKINL